MRLLDLADVCRAAGLVVHEEPGWKLRSRRSNAQEYPPSGPKAVMCHHTASPLHTDGQLDVNFICYGSSVKPVANLYLSRKAEVWVCASGPTNTNGAGRDTWGGGVPDNEMNSYAIGIEAANSGTGESWPLPQQAAYVTLVAALCWAYKIPVNSVRAHHEWAPTRKIDPAGQSQYATGSAKWDMPLFRSDVVSALYPPPPTPDPEPTDPQPQEIKDMLFIAKPTFSGATAADPWIVFYTNPGNAPRAERATNAHVKAALILGVPVVDQDSKEQYDDLRSRYGI